MFWTDLFEADLAWYRERGEAYGRLIRAMESPHFKTAIRNAARRADEIILKAFQEGDEGG